MDIQTEKLRLVKLIIDTESPELIRSVMKVFYNSSKKDFWLTLSEQQKEDIELGLAEIEKGDVVSYESIMQNHGK